MGAFLKIVSVIYLIMIWLSFGVIFLERKSGIVAPYDPAAVIIVSLVVSVLLSIPAVALYGFGQIVGDIRAIRNYQNEMRQHLQVMRSYFAILKFNEEALVSNQQIASKLYGESDQSGL